MQNKLTELYNLITVLKPGHFKSPKEFSSQFVVRGDPRLPKNRGLLRELLGDVMVRHTRGQISLQLPPVAPTPFVWPSIPTSRVWLTPSAIWCAG